MYSGDDIVAFMDHHGHAIAIAPEDLANAALNVDLDQLLPPSESVSDIFGFPGYPGPSSRRRRRLEAANASGTTNSSNSNGSASASSTLADMRRSVEEDVVLPIRPRLRPVFDEEGSSSGNLRRRKAPSSSTAGKSGKNAYTFLLFVYGRVKLIFSTSLLWLFVVLCHDLKACTVKR